MRVWWDPTLLPDGCHEVGVRSIAVWFPQLHGVRSRDSVVHVQCLPRDVDLGDCKTWMVVGIDRIGGDSRVPIQPFPQCNW